MNVKCVAAGTAALALGLSACSVSTQPDEVALEYDAGAVSSTEFDSCVEPGNRQYYGPGDQAFTYPAGQRTFEFSGADSAQMGTATVVSSDDLELKVTGLVTYTLNIRCDDLRKFHEQLGLKYEAYEEEGWVELLRDYIGQPLGRALDDATKNYNWRDLYTDAEAKSEWEEEVGTLAALYINEQGGGDFFCGPSFEAAEDEDCTTPQLTLQQPVPPEDVRDALTAAQEAVELTTAQEEENKRVEAETEAIELLVDALGPEGAVLWEAMRRGDVELVPLPSGSGLNVEMPEE